jgi:hypothetical protein
MIHESQTGFQWLLVATSPGAKCEQCDGVTSSGILTKNSPQRSLYKITSAMDTVYIYLQDLEASFERPFDKIYKICGTKQKK